MMIEYKHPADIDEPVNYKITEFNLTRWSASKLPEVIEVLSNLDLKKTMKVRVVIEEI